jgi:hypothetical protein
MPDVQSNKKTETRQAWDNPYAFRVSARVVREAIEL